MQTHGVMSEACLSSLASIMMKIEICSLLATGFNPFFLPVLPVDASRATGLPVLGPTAKNTVYSNCAESFKLLYSAFTRRTATAKRGFRTCKALPPSSPNCYPSSPGRLFPNYLKIISANGRPGRFPGGTNLSTCFMLNWPDARACGTGSWA